MSPGAVVEREAFGVTYERYALGKKLRPWVKKLGIASVCELPAAGAKAAPALYSLDLARAGAACLLVNGGDDSRRFYRRLGLAGRVTFTRVADLNQTPFPDGHFDLVWNFAYLSGCADPLGLLREMKRIARRYVAVFLVNGRNMGFPFHRLAHRLCGVPWTHGEMRMFRPGPIRLLLREAGLKPLQAGWVDCPCWPDSLGFRDIRLHRSSLAAEELDWQVPYVEHLVKGRMPAWLPAVGLLERLPLPSALKAVYAHLFFILAEK